MSVVPLATASCAKVWCLALALALGLGFSGVVHAAPADAPCRGAFLQKEYAKAAACFAALATAQKASTDRLLQLQKGRWLDNAARAYQKAAVQMQKSVQALGKKLTSAQRQSPSVLGAPKTLLRWRREVARVAFWRAEAARLLGLFLQQKLWANTTERAQAQQRRRRLLRGIAYSRLHLPAPHIRMVLCVWRLSAGAGASTKRYKLGCKKTGQSWRRGGLLPGRYALRASIGSSYTTQHQLFLAPGHALHWRIEGRHQLYLGAPGATLNWRDPLGVQRTFRGAFFDRWLLPGRHKFLVQVSGDKPHQHELLVVSGLVYSLTRMRLVSVPVGASLSLNGAKAGVTPMTAYLPGKSVQVTWKKPCYQTQRKRLVLRSVKRARTPVLVRLALASRVVQARQRARLFGILGWSGLGAGVLFGGLSGLFHGLALGAYAQVQDPASVDFRRPETTTIRIPRLDDPVAYRAGIAQGNTLRLVGHVGSGLAAAALGTGIGLLLARPRSQQCIAQGPKSADKKVTP